MLITRKVPSVDQCLSHGKYLGSMLILEGTRMQAYHTEDTVDNA